MWDVKLCLRKMDGAGSSEMLVPTLDGVTYQETVILIFTAMRSINLM